VTDFLDIQKVIVSTDVALQAHDHLRNMGKRGVEGIALWAGERAGPTFSVRECCIPLQVAIRSVDGLCVMVEADELHRINLWLFQRKFSLIAQLHSHGEEAYHSDTDDRYAIVTAVGSLSVVIPDFARGPFSLHNCAVYHLMPSGIWTRLSTFEVAQLIEVV
jgi:hypothetical protein